MVAAMVYCTFGPESQPGAKAPEVRGISLQERGGVAAGRHQEGEREGGEGSNQKTKEVKGCVV